jgi:DNA-binding GntR family transcriptional regulator
MAGVIRHHCRRPSVPGQPIPSQNTIMQTYGVARMTAHKALGLLVDEGIVVVVPGVGALVARRKG